MKRIILALTVVFLLTGCGAAESAAETEPGATAVQIAVAEEEIPATTEASTQPTEPELPWDPDARWYPTYYFDKRPNPDPNIVEGVVRFNALLRNENREPLTIQSARIEDIVQILYIDAEQYAPVFVECPPVDQWPEDAQ